MILIRSILLVGTLLALLTPLPAHAQVHVGLSGALETLPAELVSPCGHSGGMDGAPAADIRLGAPLPGPASLELRAGIHGGWAGECATPTGTRESVRVQDQWPTVESDAFRFLDVRLRLDTGPGDAYVFTLGPGQLYGGPFYIAGSGGYRWGDALRVGIELEAAAYRIPWRARDMFLHSDVSTGDIVVGEVRTEDFHRWQLGAGIRAVVEMNVF